MAAADDVLDLLEPPAGKVMPPAYSSADTVLSTPTLKAGGGQKAPSTSFDISPTPASPAETSTLSQAEADKRYREIWATKGKEAADAFYNQNAGVAGTPAITPVSAGVPAPQKAAGPVTSA